MATEGNQVVKFNGKLSSPTHPLFKHGPDVSDQYVYDRVANELVAKNRTGLRTAFNDRSQMEAAIGETFSLRQNEINAWISSNPRAGVPKAFEANPDMGNLGRGFEVTSKGGPITPVTPPERDTHSTLDTVREPPERDTHSTLDTVRELGVSFQASQTKGID